MKYPVKLALVDEDPMTSAGCPGYAESWQEAFALAEYEGYRVVSDDEGGNLEFGDSWDGEDSIVITVESRTDD